MNIRFWCKFNRICYLIDGREREVLRVIFGLLLDVSDYIDVSEMGKQKGGGWRVQDGWVEIRCEVDSWMKNFES